MFRLSKPRQTLRFFPFFLFLFFFSWKGRRVVDRGGERHVRLGTWFWLTLCVFLGCLYWSVGLTSCVWLHPILLQSVWDGDELWWIFEFVKHVVYCQSLELQLNGTDTTNCPDPSAPLQTELPVLYSHGSCICFSMSLWLLVCCFIVLCFGLVSLTTCINYCCFLFWDVLFCGFVFTLGRLLSKGEVVVGYMWCHHTTTTTAYTRMAWDVMVLLEKTVWHVMSTYIHRTQRFSMWHQTTTEH